MKVLAKKRTLIVLLLAICSVCLGFAFGNFFAGKKEATLLLVSICIELIFNICQLLNNMIIYQKVGKVKRAKSLSKSIIQNEVKNPGNIYLIYL